MHTGVQWPTPRLKWPDGKLICCTFRVAYEAFRKSGRFKKTPKIPVNVSSLSHANYGGAVGAWRLLDIFERHKIPATIGANGLAVEKWPETIKAFHQAGHEICSHGMTNDHHMTDLTPDEQRKEARDCADLIERCVGVRPVGWVGPAISSRLRRSASLRKKATRGSAILLMTMCRTSWKRMAARSSASPSSITPTTGARGLAGSATVNLFRGVQDVIRLRLSGSLARQAGRHGCDRALRTWQQAASRLRIRADDRLRQAIFARSVDSDAPRTGALHSGRIRPCARALSPARLSGFTEMTD